MKIPRSIVLIGVMALLIHGASPGFADDQAEIRVGCPPFWPDATKPQAIAEKAEVWMYAVSNLHPMDDYSYPVRMTKPDAIAIDCRYSNGRRLTIVVPGITRHCEGEYVPGGEHLNPKADGAACFTRPDADGTMGPIRTYIVEPVTLATRIDGLGLGMSRAEIFDIARTRGYEIVQDSGETGPIDVRYDVVDARVEFAAGTAKSKSVRFWHDPKVSRRSEEKSYRFGLDMEMVSLYPPGGKSFTKFRRKSRSDTAILDSWFDNERNKTQIHLYDSSAE